MPAQPLTPEQKADADRLKKLFKEWQARQRAEGKKASQEHAAEFLGIGQSAFNQYLNGNIPLNPDAALKIADLIGCRVHDFSKQIARQMAAYGNAAPVAALVSSRPAESDSDQGDIGADEIIELVILYEQADRATRELVIESLRLSPGRKPARWGRVADDQP